MAQAAPESARHVLIPCICVYVYRYRNTWVWGCSHEGCDVKPRLEAVAVGSEGHVKLVRGWHASLGKYNWAVDQVSDATVKFVSMHLGSSAS